MIEKIRRWSGLVAWKLLTCSVFTLALHLPARAQQADAPTSTPTTADVSLSSPLDYQVFQRQTRLRGTIAVNGHVAVHFNDAGLKAHGALWAQAVEVYLGKVLR